MKRMMIVAILTLAAAMPAAAQTQNQNTATADFIGSDGKQAGRATLTEGKKGGLIEMEVTGLPVNRWVAFHIHESGHCDHAHGFESAGGHFNPTKAEHGFLAANGPHAGDMPNQHVDQDGKLRAQGFNGVVSLNGNADSDDYRSQPVGGAGKRLACAVIQ